MSLLSINQSIIDAVYRTMEKALIKFSMTLIALIQSKKAVLGKI